MSPATSATHERDAIRTPADAGELRVGPMRIEVEVPSSSGDRVRWSFASGPGPLGPGMHVHPGGTEEIEVLHGAVRLRRSGTPAVVLRAGERATVPAGTPHSLWAVARHTRGVATITPSIAIDEAFVELAAAVARRPPRPWELARIARRHLDHSRAAWIPVRLQRAVLDVLALGRR